MLRMRLHAASLAWKVPQLLFLEHSRGVHCRPQFDDRSLHGFRCDREGQAGAALDSLRPGKFSDCDGNQRTRQGARRRCDETERDSFGRRTRNRKIHIDDSDLRRCPQSDERKNPLHFRRGERGADKGQGGPSPPRRERNRNPLHDEA